MVYILILLQQLLVLAKTLRQYADSDNNTLMFIMCNQMEGHLHTIINNMERAQADQKRLQKEMEDRRSEYKSLFKDYEATARELVDLKDLTATSQQLSTLAFDVMVLDGVYTSSGPNNPRSNKIPVIRALRDVTGMGLKEAKEHVEACIEWVDTPRDLRDDAFLMADNLPVMDVLKLHQLLEDQGVQVYLDFDPDDNEKTKVVEYCNCLRSADKGNGTWCTWCSRPIKK